MDENSHLQDPGLLNETPAQIDPTAELRTGYEGMLKEIRSWGYWTLGLGVLHIISSGFLDSSWGILLVLVGMASFYYRTASMFIIYTVTLSWAALSNLTGLNLQWALFALLQIYLAFRTFRDYQRFKKIEGELALVSDDYSIGNRRVARSFPWIGLASSILSILGCLTYCALTFMIVSQFGVDYPAPAYYLLLIRLVEIVAVIGFSVSLASLLARQAQKTLPIIGMVACGALMVMFIIINIVFVFS